jgi:S1-C subfamily serine protease
MHDLIDTPTSANEEPPLPPPDLWSGSSDVVPDDEIASPPLPPAPPSAPPGGDGRRPDGRRRGWPRFTGGLVAGVAVSALAVGGVVLFGGTDQPTETTATPTTVPVPVASPASAAPLGSVHELVVAARPSIAAIHTTVTESNFFGQTVQGEAAGTGFVLSADGYVVTNNHVIEGSESINVTLGDGTVETAEVVAADPRSDLAVLHIDRNDLVPLPIGDSDAIQVGDPVVAIGNALDLGSEPTVTGGMVSAKARTINEPNGQVLVNLIQTDAAISPGNSGGPLLDMAGRVVGINTAVAGQGQNIGFAISINPAQTLLSQLRDGKVPRHALLGVSTAPQSSGAGGAVVTAVSPGSGADTGGIQVGDVITALDGDAVASPEDLVAAIALHEPGDEVTVTVLRKDASKQLKIVLGAHDETPS